MCVCVCVCVHGDGVGEGGWSKCVLWKRAERDKCWLLAVVRMLAFSLNEKESY